MNFYEAIFKRRSVRRYDLTPLSDAEMEDIFAFIESVDGLKDCNVRLELLNPSAVSSKKAPHYFAAYCDKQPFEYMNAGYVLQHLDLYLQGKGYGSLWYGMAKPLGKEDKADFAILMALGKTDVPLRNGLDEFDRLPIEKLSNTDNEVTRAVRLAPSACNSQPYTLEYSDTGLKIAYKGRGALQKILRARLSKIDIGIALCHAVTAVKAVGKEVKAITPYFKTDNDCGVSILF